MMVPSSQEEGDEEPLIHPRVVNTIMTLLGSHEGAASDIQSPAETKASGFFKIKEVLRSNPSATGRAFWLGPSWSNST